MAFTTTSHDHEARQHGTNDEQTEHKSEANGEGEAQENREDQNCG